MKFLLIPVRILHTTIDVLVISITTLVLFPFLVLAVLIDVRRAFIVQWLWAKVFLFVTGTRLKITYIEPIPKTGAIILFNHSSFLDIPILVMVTGRFMFYVAKKELERFPVLGLCFKLVKTLMMPRNDLAASIKLYEEARSRLAQGDQFVIAPEGTRSRFNGISDFKSGPFIFAMSCPADLVPVVIKGARALWPAQDLLPNWRKMTSSVEVVVGEKISTQDWTESNRKAKMLELKNKFEELYK